MTVSIAAIRTAAFICTPENWVFVHPVSKENISIAWTPVPNDVIWNAV